MIYCPNCGTQNVDGVKFCVQCGAPLAPASESWRGSSNLDEPSASNQPPTAPYTPPTATAMPPQSTQSEALPYMSYATHGASNAFGSEAMNYASWAERVPGGLIDGIIALALAMVIYVPLLLIGGGDPGDGRTAALGCFGTSAAWLLSIGFQAFNNIYLRGTRGSSIGQGVMGLKTVTADNNIPSFGTLGIRFVVAIVIGFIPCGGLVDLLWPLWDEKKQTLHDKAASTFVVKA